MTAERVATETSPAGRAVVLIGFMGAGKSSVGKALAVRLALPFVDTDALIEQRFGPIAALFAERGERGFREIEEDVVTAVLEEARKLPAVIALGGGAVTSAGVRAALVRHAHIAWLNAGLEVLRERVAAQGTTRPLAAEATEFARLYGERAPLYASVCTARFDNDAGRTVDALVAELAAWAGREPAPAERAG